MNANILPDELPEHLRNDATATFLEQVALDAVAKDTVPTEENIERLMKERLDRNRAIAESQDVREAIRENMAGA